MSRVLIEVTQEDIKNGVRGDPCNCPTAHAATRATHGTVPLRVGALVIKFGPIGSSVASKLPIEAREFIYDFDWGKPVEPFSFEIELPEAVSP